MTNIRLAPDDSKETGMKTKFAVWYMRPDFFRDGIMGVDWLRKQGMMPDPANLERTHIHLKDLELEGGAQQLERVFRDMQGEVWSPNGEAMGLIEAKGLRHTSMSMGDIVVVDGRAHIVDRFGFAELVGQGEK